MSIDPDGDDERDVTRSSTAPVMRHADQNDC